MKTINVLLIATSFSVVSVAHAGVAELQDLENKENALRVQLYEFGEASKDPIDKQLLDGFIKEIDNDIINAIERSHIDESNCERLASKFYDLAEVSNQSLSKYGATHPQISTLTLAQAQYAESVCHAYLTKMK